MTCNLPRILLLSLILLGFARALWAQDLYQGEAQVSGPDEASRSNGIVEALRQVLVKVSANPAAADNPALQGTLSKASSLMQLYDYRQELGRDASGKAVAKSFLRVRFFPQSVDQALMRAGMPVWGRERPRVLLLIEENGAWLDNVALYALVQRAADRGISVRFPNQQLLLDSEQSALSSNDLRALSQQLGGGMVLAGRWQSGSLQLDDGRRNEAVRVPAGRSDAELHALADRMIQALIRQQLAANNQQPEEFDATVEGLGGAGDYARALSELGKLSSVKQVRVLGADRLGLRLRLTVLGGAERLQQGVINTGSFDMPSIEPAVLQLR